MKLTGIWTDDSKLRAVFSWLTRIGAAPKFGTLPIAYYQQDQCKAIETLEKSLVLHGLAPDSELRFSNGFFVARTAPGKWRKVALLTCGTITPWSQGVITCAKEQAAL